MNDQIEQTEERKAEGSEIPQGPVDQADGASGAAADPTGADAPASDDEETE